MTGPSGEGRDLGAHEVDDGAELDSAGEGDMATRLPGDDGPSTTPPESAERAPLTTDSVVARASADAADLLSDDVVSFSAGLADLDRARLQRRLESAKVRGIGDWKKAVLGLRYEHEEAERAGARRASRAPAEPWRALLVTNDKGEPLSTFANLCTILENAWPGRLSYDTMSNRPCVDGRPATDHDVMAVRRWLGKAPWCLTFGKEDVGDALAYVGREAHAFHPVRDYLAGLTWDGVARLDRAATMLLGIPATDRLSCTMVRRTLIAMAARGLEPGCKVDTCLVLLGRQGAKKSTFFRVLGGEWFGDSKIDIGDRKGTMTMHSTWVQEWAEVDRVVAKHNDSESKAYISQQSDSYVPMYGRGVITVPRSWVVAGTTNKPRFLTDASGSRRWWVLDLRSNGPAWRVDAALVASRRDQLFAEAVHVFREFKRLQAEGVTDDENANRWWLNDAEERERETRTAEFQVENAWSETVGRWLAGEPVTCPDCKGTGNGSKSYGGVHEPCKTCNATKTITRPDLHRCETSGREFVTPAMVLTGALGIPPERHRQHGTTIADTLAELGWRSGARRRVAGVQVTPYYAPDPPPPVEPVAVEAPAAEHVEPVGAPSPAWSALATDALVNAIASMAPGDPGRAAIERELSARLAAERAAP